jgi:ribonuclease BN (tRNA processing enzyme)
LAAGLGAALGSRWETAYCLVADPGSPAFGVPGALCLGTWDAGRWRLLDMEPLCSLNAARYRLPLLLALKRLLGRAPAGVLLLDPPGVVRGTAGAELLAGLVQTADIDRLLLLQRPGQPLSPAPTLATLGLPIIKVQSAAQAHQPSKVQRARQRTLLWDRYLAGAAELSVALADTQILGADPTGEDNAYWRGRQVALLAGGRCVGLGEVQGSEAGLLHIRTPATPVPGAALLVRDAARDADGLLTSRRRPAAPDMPPPDLQVRAAVEPLLPFRPLFPLGEAVAILVNGVLGDPLLHLRLRHRRRSLLLDLGEGSRLPARIAHQISDIFISHAHLDHIGGFLGLLRARIGTREPCRVWGPPGLAGHIGHLLQGILWDRIGAGGPLFDVAELHPGRLLRCRLQAGLPAQPLPDLPLADNLILDDPDLRVRAIALDHGTPVLAYGLETRARLNVRAERLAALGLSPGPWLGRLKAEFLGQDLERVLELPDGRRLPAQELLRLTPGRRLVFATDLADSPANRQTLTALAMGADVLVLEASFLAADQAQAATTGHLTVRACGEIAAAAQVAQLVPFHFSHRYEREPEQIYRELRRWFPASRTLAPEGWVGEGGHADHADE